MKLSDFLYLCKEASNTTLSEDGVHFGCDCGCGGDFYEEHFDMWEYAHNEVEEARSKLLSFIKENNIPISIDIDWD